MTLGEHFGELRRRLFYAAVPVVVIAAVCFVFSDAILKILKAPAGAGFEINAFGPMDGFAIRWKVALYARAAAGLAQLGLPACRLHCAGS